MLITVKKNGENIDEIGLEGNLVKNTSKKAVYHIKKKDLVVALQLIYEKVGIKKVKVEMEASDFQYKEEQKEKVTTSTSEKKLTIMEFLEQQTAEHLSILEQDKDLEAFFQAIGFVDESRIFQKLYQELITISEKKMMELTLAYVCHGGRATKIYRIIFGKIYGLEELSEKSETYLIMKNSLNKWLDKNQYNRYFKSTFSYRHFLKFLLHHTGYSYFK